jgi:hypothetical protein
MQIYTKPTNKLCIFMENKMITAEMKEKMFEKWWMDAPARMTDNLTGLDRFDAYKVFCSSLDLILPLLEKSLEANRFYAAKKNWGYNEKPKNQSHLAWMIESHDCGYCQENEKFVGGKTARQAIQEIEAALRNITGGEKC